MSDLTTASSHTTQSADNSADSIKNETEARDAELLSIFARTESLFLEEVTKLSSIVTSKDTDSLAEPPEDAAKVLYDHLNDLKARVVVEGKAAGFSTKEIEELLSEGEADFKRRLAEADKYRVRRAVPATKRPEPPKGDVAPLHFKPGGC